MDFLWKKEPSGLLIDIFANVDSVDVLSRDIKILLGIERSKKKNKTSTDLRERGNKQIRKQNWYSAMTHYNVSLRYAEIDTENVSFAYANRSTCFLKMEKYDKCLIDIELAINANYPQRLMSKLKERRDFCLKQMNKTASLTEMTVPRLDFDADENFPGMSNVLKMEYNEKYGHHFIAKCDIDVGKVVMVEEAYVTSTIFVPGSNICDACFKHSMNFIACSNCTSALFCNEACAKDYLHNMRCGRGTNDDNHLVEFTLRSIMLTFCIFPGEAGELMNFVEKAIVERKKRGQVSNALVDMESKYRLFLQLNFWLSTAEKQRMIVVGYEAFQLLMRKPGMRELFGRPDVWRFLMHLFVMHASLIFCNSFQSEVHGFIFLLRNHINHSCVPNLLCSCYENKSVVITSRRIKKGDQLFISYDEYYFFQPREMRQQKLYKDFGFQCECEKCENIYWPISSHRIKSDPNYQLIIANKEVNSSDVTKRVFMKKKCLEILIKYSDSVWYTELDMVSHLYQHFSTETLY